MPYYAQQRGDYATHGYGRGDPGFLSSLWKGIKKVALPAIGFAIGGPAGLAIGSSLGGGARTPPIMAPQKPMPSRSGRIAVGPMSYRSTAYFPPVPQFTGQAMSRATSYVGAMPSADASGCCARGFHLAKDGSGKCVRNRRMNVANPRALRRSMRRVQGFEKLARRTISFTRRVKMKK